MDDYLDAITKVAESELKNSQLSDEVVWLEITKCLFNNPSAINNNTNNDILKTSDYILEQFKQRFRE